MNIHIDSVTNAPQITPVIPYDLSLGIDDRVRVMFLRLGLGLVG